MVGVSNERKIMDNIDWKHLLFDFDGRINRGKFWLGAVVLWAVSTLILFIAIAVSNNVLWTVLAITYIAIIWVGLAISIKRWHDRGKSGWWVLIGFVPLIGGLWALIETGFLPGTDGPNEYGPDPLAG